MIRFFSISKTDNNSAQNYLVTDNEGNPVFSKSIAKGQYFRVRYNDSDTGLLYISYYNREIPLAKTPFANDKAFTFDFDPDSIFSVRLTQNESPLLELPYHGIYHFQMNFSNKDGLTLFHFDDGFPEITAPVEAILPLRYLTTEKEYDQLLAYSNYKVAVDSFWLERSSHQPERAKNMIARYYSRVQNANKWFSSFQEGWKTDRGLIYIIYGPPSDVYLKQGEEEWIYGETGNAMSIEFYFDKIANPYTTNDFQLQRSPAYKTSWYIAIENWRR